MSRKNILPRLPETLDDGDPMVQSQPRLVAIYPLAKLQHRLGNLPVQGGYLCGSLSIADLCARSKGG